MEKDSVNISVRVPPETYAALKRSAEEADRTISAEARRAMRRYAAELPDREGSPAKAG